MRPLLTKNFTELENQVWALLYEKQLHRMQSWDFVHSLLLQWFETANLVADRCPDALEVSEHLYATTGRRLTDAKDPYLSDPDRYAPLHDKHFPATNYIRGLDEIEFTPLPDLAHDYFGHMPQIFNPISAHLQWKIADMFQRADENQKKDLYSLAWYVIEYSVVKENGIPKIYWAWLLSSPWDFQKFVDNWFNLIPADLEIIIQTDRSPEKSHTNLFIFENIDHMMDMVNNYEQRIIWK